MTRNPHLKDTNGVVMVVMDGWGLRESEKGNAIKAANTPNMCELTEKYAYTQLRADGENVGLPEGQMGTSEVNHLTIGAGRIIYQELVRLNKEVESGRFFENEVLLEAMERAKANGASLHLKGLVSDGGVHSHINHFKAVLKLAKDKGVGDVCVHVFTDGRDTLPKSGKGFVEELEKYMQDLGVGRIVSVSGRYFAMDRDKNWERTERAYLAVAHGQGHQFASAVEVLESNYQKGVTDEFIEPSVVGTPRPIQEKDVVVFVNFRTDRPRQMVEMFGERGPAGVYYVTLTRYNPAYNVHVAYPPEEVSNSLGEVISRAGLRQLRVTETEKFAHLTFFLNCKEETKFEGEDRIMLDSYSDIPTHDLRPEMRTPDITREIVQAINDRSHDVIFTNICNCDMVGHTGNFPAIVKGVEATDKALGEIVRAAVAHDYEVIITADHGNAEETIDEASGQPMTSHTLNPVPLVLVSSRYHELKEGTGKLIDIAPTVLTMLGLETPREMTGKSLV